MTTQSRSSQTTGRIARARPPAAPGPVSAADRRLRRARTVALAGLLSLASAATLRAATIAVTSTASDRGSFTELSCLPPGSDVDAGPGASTVTGGATLAAAESDGRVTLREAICVANNTPEADVVTLSAATYTLDVADNYWYGPNGLPPIGDDITIEGNGAVLRRNPSNDDGVFGRRFRFFFVSRRTLTDGIAVVGGVDRARLTLRDLTLRGGLARGGRASAGGGGGGMGGAVFNQGFLELERVTFYANAAQGGESGRPSAGFPPLAVYFGGGGGMGEDVILTSGGGFGPGSFGGALGGNDLHDENGHVRFGCGGGAGFGLASGGDATHTGDDFGVISGNGGGLGNVGGSAFCAFTDYCAGLGRDGGGGGGAFLGSDETPASDGRGGDFGQSGREAGSCGGGGGVGAGGASGTALWSAGSGGFGGGGASALVLGLSLPDFFLAGAGGFGGGGGADLVGGGLMGFGGGQGGILAEMYLPSGGGGAGLGGALFNHGGEVVARNTTWTGNRAIGGRVPANDLGATSARAGSGLGGAIFNLDGALDLRSSTLAGNRAVRGPGGLGPAGAAGGALYNRIQNPDVYGFAPGVTILSSILADSLDADGAPISDCNHSARGGASLGSDLAISEGNLFEIASDLANTWLHAGCSPGSSILGDPRLAPLGDRGGSTPTMALGEGSPALHAAGPACEGLEEDQRGRPRPVGAGCDIGAYEVGEDFGDAPAPAYPTLLADDGARHLAPASPVLFLGDLAPGDEADGRPTADADGDGAEEDGVVWTSRVSPGTGAGLEVRVSAAGLVSAWVDWGGDGSWNDPEDRILEDAPVVAGANDFVVAVPPTAALGTTFGRFRVASDGGLAPTGPASDGEVEDHPVLVEVPVEVRVGNATVPEGSGGGTSVLGIPVQVTTTSTASSVVLSLVSGTATGGVDFTDPGPTLVEFEAGGELTRIVEIAVAADDVVEGDEAFGVLLSGPSLGAIVLAAEGSGTITDDDTTTLDLTSVAGGSAEGDGGTSLRTFSVTLGQAVQGGFGIQVRTADGTATAGSGDYVGDPQVVAFAGTPGESHPVSVGIRGDRVVEADEAFTVSLGSLSDLAAGVDPARIVVDALSEVVEILNDDATTVLLSPLASSGPEGDEGTTDRTFSVALEHAVQGGFELGFDVLDGTASSAAGDFVGDGGSLAFAGTAGETATLTVAVRGDTLVEADETFSVALGILGALGAGVDPADITVDAEPEVGWIVNDDSTRISIADAEAAEDDGSVTVTVSMTHESELPVTVFFSSADGTAGDESSDGDYRSASGTLTLEPGETSVTLVVVLETDAVEEPDEWFFVDLGVAEPADVAFVDDGRADVTIADDDDRGAPVVLGVAAGANGDLSECSQVGRPVHRLTADFDQAMFDPSGDDVAGDVTNPAHYRLLASGPDLDFSTSGCGGTPTGDDVEIPLESLQWNGADSAVVASVGTALADGLYELRLCRELRDLHGNLLDGGGDGGPGRDFARRFRVERSNLFANAHFDHCGTIAPTFAPWQVDATSPDVVRPDGDDSLGSALSGSARVESFGPDSVTLDQCAALETVGPLELRVRLRSTSAPTALAAATLFCQILDSAGCTGRVLSEAFATALVEDTAAEFVELSRAVVAPPGASSARCGLDLTPLTAGDPLSTTDVDRFFLGPVADLFADGFESGDLSGWSSEAP